MAILEGVCSINVVPSLATAAMRKRSAVVTITAVPSLDIAGLAYVTQSLAFAGTLRGGDVLEIDVDKMSVKLNGVDARANFSGVFPLLYTGTNELRWWDRDVRYGRFGTARFGRRRWGGGSPLPPRDVDLEVVHRPRYL